MAGPTPAMSFSTLLRRSAPSSPTATRFRIAPFANRDNITTHLPYSTQALLNVDSARSREDSYGVNAPPLGSLPSEVAQLRQEMRDKMRRLHFGNLASDLRGMSPARYDQTAEEKDVDDASASDRYDLPGRFGAYVVDDLLPRLQPHLERVAKFVHCQPTLSSVAVFSATLFRAYRITWPEICQMATIFSSPMFFKRLTAGSARRIDTVDAAANIAIPATRFSVIRSGVRALGRMVEVGTQAFFLPLAISNAPTLLSLLGGVVRINMPKIVRIGVAQGRRVAIAHIAHRTPNGNNNLGVSILSTLGGVVALGSIAALAFSDIGGSTPPASLPQVSTSDVPSTPSETIARPEEDDTSDAVSETSERSNATSTDSGRTVTPTSVTAASSEVAAPQGNRDSAQQDSSRLREEMMKLWIAQRTSEEHRREAARCVIT